MFIKSVILLSVSFFSLYSDPAGDLIDAALHGDLKKAESALRSGAAPDEKTKSDVRSPKPGENSGVYKAGTSPLHIASAEGHLETVKLLIVKGAYINAKDSGGRTALMSASENGHSEIAKLLMEYKADVNAKDLSGATALMSASEKGHSEIAKLLMAHKADVNARDSNRTTALIYAAGNGHLETVKLLLARKADVNAKDSDGTTALIYAAGNGHSETARLLIANGADVNARDEDSRTPLIYASEKGDIETVRLLLTNQAKLNFRDSEGRTALLLAAENGHTETARLLIMKGADVNARDNSGFTCLLYAVMKDNTDTVKLLMKKKADPNAKLQCINCDNKEKSPLLIALEKGNLKTAELLLKNGADPNITDIAGEPPLVYAVEKNQIEAVRLLLKYKADVNGINRGGMPVLLTALSEKRKEIAGLLALHNADLLSENKYGYNVIMAAAGCGEMDILRKAVEKKGKINGRTSSGMTALLYALSEGQEEAAEFLIKNNADISAESEKGKTAALAAAEGGCLRILKIILEKNADSLKDRDSAGETLLSAAAKNGHTETVKFLIEKGVELKTESSIDYDERRRSPWLYACESGSIETVKYFMDKGIGINDQSSAGATCLMIAAQKGRTGLVRYLLDQGADPNIRIKDGYSAIMGASMEGHTETVKMLAEAKADVNAAFEDGSRAVLYASEKNYFETVKILVDHHAEINIKNDRGYTPSFYAVQHRNLQMLKLFLEKGALSEHGALAVHEAAQKGDTEIFQIFFSYALSERLKNAALGTAASAGHLKLVQLLIENGASVNFRENPEQHSALMSAAGNGHSETVKFLIKNGADMNARIVCSGCANEGKTALFFAFEKSHSETARILIRSDADVNLRYSGGWTILMHFSKTGYQSDLIKLLLEKGAAVNLKNEEGDSALSLSLQKDRPLSGTELILAKFDFGFSEPKGKEEKLLHFFYVLSRSAELDAAYRKKFLEALAVSLKRRMKQNSLYHTLLWFILSGLSSEDAEAVFPKTDRTIPGMLIFQNRFQMDFHADIYRCLGKYSSLHRDFIPAESYVSLLLEQNENLLESLQKDSDLKWYFQTSFAEKKGTAYQLSEEKKKPEIVIQSGHSGSAPLISFSPDGKTFASASSDNTAKIWNIAGRLLHDLKGHESPLTHIQYSGDGNRIATMAKDGTVRIWSSAGTFLYEPVKDALAVDFSPSGNSFLTLDSRNIRLWNSEGKIQNVLPLQKAVNQAFYTDSEKSLIVFFQDETVQILSLNGKILHSFENRRLGGYSGRSPDRKLYSVYMNHNEFKILSTSGKILRSVSKGIGLIFSLGSRHFVHVTAESWKILNIDGTKTGEFKNPDDTFRDVVLSKDGKMLATASTENVRFWTAENGQVRKLEGGRMIYFSPDEKILVTAGEKSMEIYNTAYLRASGQIQPVRELKNASIRLKGLIYSPSEKNLVYTAENTGYLRNHEGKFLQELKGHQDRISHTAYSPDGKYSATVSGNYLRGNYEVRVWNSEGTLVRELRGHSGWIHNIAFSPDGKRLATSSKDNTARIWNLEDGSFRILEGHQKKINHIVFSPNGQNALTASEDGTLKVWDLEGKELRTLRGKPDLWLYYADYSPEGSRIAASSHGRVYIWNSEGVLLHSIDSPGSEIRKLQFSPDGKTIVFVPKEGKAELMSSEGKRIRVLKEHSGNVTSILFSKSGEYFITSSEDTSIRIWTKDGKPVRKLKGHSATVLSLQFLNEGKLLVSSSEDRTVRYWDMESAEKDRSSFGDLIASQTFFEDGSSLFFTPDNYYMVSDESSLNYITFRKGKNIYDFDQFDLKFNRPDIIMKRLKNLFLLKRQAGESDDSYAERTEDYSGRIKLLEAYWENRVRRNGFEPEILKGENRVHAADIYNLKIDGKRADTPNFDFRTANEKISVSFRIKDEKETHMDIVGYKIFVKGVPLNGQNIVRLPAPERNPEITAEIRLSVLEDIGRSSGENTIELVGYTADLIESNRMKFEMKYDFRGKKKKNLYLVTLGTKKYRSGKSDLSDLKYSVNDAEDMQEMFSGCYLNLGSAKSESERKERAEKFKEEYALNEKDRGRRGKCRIQILELENQFFLSGFSDGGKYSAVILQKDDEISREFSRPLSERNVLKIIRLSAEKIGFSYSDAKNNKNKSYDSVISLNLTDEEISRKGISKIKDLLSITDVDDTVIFFISGHGVRADTKPETALQIQRELGMKDSPGDLSLDKKFYNIYYYMTWDSNSKTPWENGIPMEYFRNALDGIHARQKILLIDTCQSGDRMELSGYRPSLKKLDEIKELQLAYKIKGTERGIRRKGDSDESDDLLSIEALDRKIYEENSKIAFEWEMKEIAKMFPELRRGTGTIEISAASGSQSALESEKWKNGAFTFTIKEAILDEQAKSGDTITVKSLRKYILDRVERLTEGRQIPTVTRDITGRDFSVVE